MKRFRYYQTYIYNRSGILWLLLLLLYNTAAAQTRHALVIGIGTYQDKNWGNINGDADVKLVDAVLASAGYKDVTTLVNRQATKRAIVNAFRRLEKKCHEGDVVLIHFSGHGQQMTDVNGDEVKDHLDEAWIPYDAYRKYCAHDRGDKHLSDDEIYGLLSDIRRKIGNKGEILVVVDACHSGDSSRGNDDEVIRGVFDKFVIPGKVKMYATKLHQEEWTTLSACKDYQMNAEMRTPKVGKLTYALCCLLKNKSIRDNKMLMGFLYTFINKNSTIPQTPVLTGEAGMNIIDILR